MNKSDIEFDPTFVARNLVTKNKLQHKFKQLQE